MGYDALGNWDGYPDPPVSGDTPSPPTLIMPDVVVTAPAPQQQQLSNDALRAQAMITANEAREYASSLRLSADDPNMSASQAEQLRMQAMEQEALAAAALLNMPAASQNQVLNGVPDNYGWQNDDLPLPPPMMVEPNSGTPTTGNSQPSVGSLPNIAGGLLSSLKPGQGDSVAPVERQTDFRLRLKAISGQESRVYGARGGGNILSILHQTGGLLFPYTPSVSFNQGVDYGAAAPIHSNFDFATYTRTPPPEISITGKFSVQNQMEGEYALAVLHFLRTVSKMNFGEQAATQGTAGIPPPLLVLSGYGTYMFNGLRVILKSHSWQFDETIDHVMVTTAGGSARIPALFTISINLTVQTTPKAARKTFNLEDFRTGKLMLRGGWI